MKKYSSISLIIGSISFIGILIQNYRLLKMYEKASGKTRAFFGITEISQLDIKLYLGIISLIGLVLGILSIRKNEDRRILSIAIALNIIAFTLLFIRLWTYCI